MGTEAENMESAYRSAELTLLHTWNIARVYVGKLTQTAQGVRLAFHSAFGAYEEISSQYLNANILPYVDKLHGISSAVRSIDSLDVNLKLFDVLGRLGVRGLWHFWQATQFPEDQEQLRQEQLDSAKDYALAIRQMIANNPALMSPIKDDQAIDIGIALFLLGLHPDNKPDMQNWLEQIFQRCAFAHRSHGHYPCILRHYADLLEHPKAGDDDYRQEVTAASILYPITAFWAAAHGFDVLYTNIGLFQKECLAHCNFQFWYPNENSEQRLYTNAAPHGVMLSDVNVGQSKADFLNHIFREVESTPYFKELSAVRSGLWPLIAVACRHHRLPVPLNFFPLPQQPPPDSPLPVDN